MRQYYSAHSAEVPNFTLGAPGTVWTLIDSEWWSRWCRYTRFTTTTTAAATAAAATAAAATAAGTTAGDSTTATDAATAAVPARRSSYTGAAAAANTAAASSSVHRYSRSYSTDVNSTLSASAAPPRPGQINNWRLRLPNSGSSGDAHIVETVREGRDYELIPPAVWDAFKVSANY
jgi:DUSP domain